MAWFANERAPAGRAAFVAALDADDWVDPLSAVVVNRSRSAMPPDDPLADRGAPPEWWNDNDDGMADAMDVLSGLSG